MPRLLVVILFSFCAELLLGQSPHGDFFTMDCIICHSASSWKLDENIYSFLHDTTGFPLVGEHQLVDCKSCHSSLVFSEAQNTCISCHEDIHNQTVGFDCARCHDSKSWLVENISDVHQQNGFPLLGMHSILACNECHQEADVLRFEPMGNECIICHTTDYQNTSKPDHQKAGYSSDCAECHNINSFEWAASGFNHDFFPLTGAHEITDCAQCHLGSTYSDISPDCISCHQDDFNATRNPNHEANGFSTHCVDCHTTASDWAPAKFTDHDAEYFPIYSGKHAGAWNLCAECHTEDGNMATFSCTVCHDHNQEKTDKEHASVGGYNYNSTSCIACHPMGDLSDPFNHNETNFPLTGAHIVTECLDCHSQGYAGTPSLCAECHLTDFEESNNPDHVSLGFSDDCASCHTTSPGWTPASMPNHNEFFALNGSHATIAAECISCHDGNFNETPNTCAECHVNEYNSTDNPPHEQLGFSTDCASCHTEVAWQPADFEHDEQFFPIYSGKHQGTWNECSECHTTGNYASFSCTECHEHNKIETDEVHGGISGYLYSSEACLACHPIGSAENAFDHNTTNFPLTGAHTAVECASCHLNGYAGTSTLCMDCHTTDFNQTTNPNHTALGLSNDCATCHTTEPGWSPASFDVHNDYYVIQGAHTAIANDCATCHNGDYANTPNTCAGCHIDDYNTTSNPNHQQAGYSTECATCHNQNAWQPANFDHDLTNFPLTGAHTAVECASCHVNGYAGTSTLCMDCHTTDFNQTTNPNHTALGLSNDCATCHTTEPGWSPASFDVHNDYYVIQGAHTAIVNDCATCHNGDYANTPNTCAGCHIDNYNATTDPNHQQAGYSTECATCHNQNAWQPANFDHDLTNFPLTGAHTAVECASCHLNGYAGTSTLCMDCHTTDFNQTTNPNHTALGLSNDCATCHTTEPGWSPASFDVHNDYYVIQGAHTAIANDCATCHNGDYANTPNTCAGCHIDNYNATTDPNHQQAGYSTECATCHSQNAWQPANFDHDLTNFPLTGAHTAVECASCHLNGYAGTSTQCMDCHTTDFNQTTNPNHTALGLSNDCATCHTTEPGWSPASFDIHNDYYVIQGAHTAIANDCAACHNGDYANTPNTCAGCHIDNYNATTDPNHQQAGYSTECATCHNQNAWQPANFDHDLTNFPLTGAHTAVECASCHLNGYAGTSTLCMDCHTTDFNQTTNPNHTALGLSNDCATCHTTEPGWSPASFDVHNDYYVIQGAHTAIANDCAACHNGDYANTPNTCAGCHIDNYNATTDPNHQQAGYSTECATCHNQNAWQPANFDHDLTNFPLTGSHTAVECASCHVNGYAGTSTLCMDCHTTDFNQTTNPNHTALGISNDCATCHTTEPGWSPASFDVHNDYYVIQGAHTAIANDCVACHNGDYANTPNTCAGCHIDNYNATTDPNHQQAGYSTECATCHNQNAWQPANFDHDLTNFPLTGAHTAVECASCHTNGYAGTSTLCVDCHTNDFNQTTNPNHTALGISNDCATCHTTEPGWSPASFDVHNDYYVIQGAHTAIGNDCAACHNGDYANTPNTCAGCHIDNYNATTDPNHQQAGYSTECATCHSQNAWQPANFDHDLTNFPLTGAHTAVECASCHVNGYAGTSTLCVDCHTTDFNQTTNPNHTALGISNDCATCHTTEPGWSPASFDVHNDYYVIQGAHTAIANDCAACHNGDYANTPNTCAGCHIDHYNATTDPNHQQAGYSTECATCHNQNAWQPANFDHDLTNFPLTGAHTAVECASCHVNGYAGTSTLCVDCHTTDFNQTTNPNHTALGISNDCVTCHTTEPGWSPASFDVHNDYYVIQGAHTAIANDCAACHNGDYANTPNTCAGCHIDNYNATTDPNHQQAGYSTECATCHSQNAWQPANFDHDLTNFPLTGAHTAVECASCHLNGYAGTSTQCMDCHTTDFNQTTNPNHTALGLSNDCATCHTTEPGWSPASFDVHNDYYVIQGAHTAIANNCATCHNGDYANTPNTCAGCHIDDYNTTSDPNHQQAGFPTQCTDCHSQNAWEPSTFNHDGQYFPIYSGRHRNEWDQCSDCHNNAGNFAVFTCIECHEHSNKSKVDNDHKGENGYQYTPTSCFECHPNGRAD